MNLPQAIGRLIAREDLGPDDMAAVVGAIMDGGGTPAQIGALLVALRMKGETPSEIAGAARAMRARVTPVRCDASPLVDTCGTGGDGRQTLNVSTIAAVVVAAAGVHVAKH
ncbi:MAG: anthranilate phosphoribosyltransferase, partial [Deltaproteobacteria bacterium]|nr:anthranilate phosphoribosyltransferase [Deltaproteobacteria bacterium]